MKRTNQQRRFISKWLLIPALILIGLLAVMPAAAQENVEAQATLNAPEAALTVGDPIALTLTVTHPAGDHVIAPELEQAWGDFVVQDISTPQFVDNGDGSATTTLVIDARLFAPGAFTTPPLTVKIADSAGQVVDVVAPPAAVEIGSVLVEGDTALRDIKPQAELPYVNLIPWIIVGVSLAIAAVIIILAVRRSRALRALAAVDNRLPHEVALDELERIEGLSLPEQARFKEHYSMISDCLRQYMEKRVDVPMMERTTAEIEAGLRQTSLSRAVSGQYISLLDVSDLVKFSEFEPDVGNAYGLLESARQIVLNTKPVNKVDPGPDDSSSGPTPTARQDSDIKLSQNGTYKQMEVGA